MIRNGFMSIAKQIISMKSTRTAASSINNPPDDIQVVGDVTTPNNHARELLSAYAFSTSSTIRRWESCKPPKSSIKSTGIALSICSYNMLSQSNLTDTNYLYRHVNANEQQYLTWNRRSELMRREFQLLDADVFCLQEIEAQHYDQFYLPLFTNLGYTGLFKKRSFKDDGCAVFWRSTKLTAVDHRLIPYFVALNTSLDRDNIGIVVKFKLNEMINDDHNVLIANTHLLFNQGRGDVKLAQLAVLFAHIDQMLSRNVDGTMRDSLIICGDLNIEPLSPVYNFIVQGSLLYAGQPRNELSGQGRIGGICLGNDLIPKNARVTNACTLIDSSNLDESNSSSSIEQSDHHKDSSKVGTLSHQLSLMSVYRHITASGRMEVSTYHRESAMPDYIFYSVASKRVQMRGNQQLVCNAVREGRLHCMSRLSLPDVRMLDETVGRLPNRYLPSDHVPLLANFMIINDKSTNDD